MKVENKIKEDIKKRKYWENIIKILKRRNIKKKDIRRK